MQSKKRSDFQRSYGRIKSRKLRDENVRLIEEILPKVKFNSFGEFVKNYTEVWLEIGFGGGEHLAHRAQQKPQIGFVGFEPYINGAVKLLREIEEKDIKNIRLHNGDAREVITEFPSESVTRIFILFPDPWPKKKHNKRRIISHQTIDMLAKVIKAGGEINIATDHADYAKWIIRHFLERNDFSWNGEWKQEFAGHTQTKYQKKACEAGRVPVFFTFSKN